MNRQTWLSDRRAQAERSYTANAPTYDEREPSSPVHAALLAQVIASVDVGGTILDAPCGTGRYMDAILGAGRRVVGIDQSAGMLEQARIGHPDVPVEHTCLQELAFHDAFDAAICIDAMEYVPPEDWPVVLDNLRRAVRPGGLVYLTVEEVDRQGGRPRVRGGARGRPAGRPRRTPPTRWRLPLLPDARSGCRLAHCGPTGDRRPGHQCGHQLRLLAPPDPALRRPGRRSRR